MSSAASQATGEPTAGVTDQPGATAPLPVLSRALLEKHLVLLRGFDIPSMMRTLYTARGKEGLVRDPCFRVIDAINNRLSKDLEGRGISQMDLDRLLVKFLDYVFRWIMPDLEEAWDIYKRTYLFDAQGHWLGLPSVCGPAEAKPREATGPPREKHG
ncbi:hypothetical protein BDW67DRAFT_169227 [Aspergillus spinulosporus]